MIRTRLKAVAFALAAMAIGALPAMADDPITLKFAHIFPANHYLWTEGGKTFGDKVTAATNGRVKFEVYPAGQLGKDPLAMLQSGIADVVILSTSYLPEKFPLSSVTELPGMGNTSCASTVRLWALAKLGAPLNDAEYKPLGLHVLFVNNLPAYRLVNATKRVTTLDDMKGLKIRANGAAMEDTVRALGAVPIRINSPDLYNALLRGTVDGSVFPYSGLPGLKLEKVMKESTDGVSLGSGTVLYLMTEARWNKLPADVKAAMEQAAPAAQQNLCAWQDEETKRVVSEIVAHEGHTVTMLSDEQKKLWTERLSGVSEKWAKDMDAAGKPGSAMLAALRATP